MQDDNQNNLIERIQNQMIAAIKTTNASQVNVEKFEIMDDKLDSLLEQLYQLIKNRR
jgi:hypothetical protein